MTPKQMLRLRKKITHREGREFVGYLTPPEVVHLVEKMEGVEITEWSNHQYKNAKENVKKGVGNGTWFYFTLKNPGQFFGLTP